MSRYEVLEGAGPRVEPLPFTDAEYERRLRGVRTLMAERDLAAFVTFTPENVYYLTAHDSPGYYFYTATLITHDRPPINVLRVIETSNTLGRGSARLAVGVGDIEDPVAATLWLLKELGVAGRTVGAEASAFFVSPARYFQLQEGVRAAGGRLVDASMLVEQLRMVKSSEELVYMREAAKAVSHAMGVALDASHVGANENEVAAVTVADLIRAGSEEAGLPQFITSGPRTSLVHSTWAGRVYERGDVLNYELAGVFKRYASPFFRCAVVGGPSPEQQGIADMVLEILQTVLEAIKPGVPALEIHAKNRAVFEKHGHVGWPHHRTGYSVGINYPPDWGEGNIISIWDGETRPLQAGMTFHLVPGYSELNRHTVVISETILVTETGCEALTDYPRKLFSV